MSATTDFGDRVREFGSAVADGWTRERFGLLGAVGLPEFDGAPVRPLRSSQRP